MYFRFFFIILLFLMAQACDTPSLPTIDIMDYPVVLRDTTVVDDYHGTTVSDPYRWLEDDNSAETKEWVEAQDTISPGCNQ